ncbi:uncharacterized protein ACA1_050630 [Acanthamoeba castellanii str. Neff]|nr:uncharacterized protein ACA1_050630 [Acanthamoeba castellanii str. Neff]ELR12503.1 hypothetical protein ACA1_050630 [Acanthamoeba castellanii str. Neff]
MASVESRLKLVEQVEFKGAFTDDEFASYRNLFLKYDANKTLALELFELHQMYEDMGETKTNLQLRQLIRDANPDTSSADGIDYKAFLTVLLKDKKGQTRSALGGLFVQLLKPVEAKQHTSAIGKFANVFEQQAAQQTNDTISEQNIKMQRDARREQENRKREALAKLKAEEEEKARLEAERKARVQAGLAKLKANINAS